MKGVIRQARHLKVRETNEAGSACANRSDPFWSSREDSGPPEGDSIRSRVYLPRSSSAVAQTYSAPATRASRRGEVPIEAESMWVCT